MEGLFNGFQLKLIDLDPLFGAIKREDALWGVVAALRALRRSRFYFLFAYDTAFEPGEGHHASTNDERAKFTKGLDS